jgi:hypothetical protein
LPSPEAVMSFPDRIEGWARELGELADYLDAA